jgi:hypothetical protein
LCLSDFYFLLSTGININFRSLKVLDMTVCDL